MNTTPLPVHSGFARAALLFGRTCVGLAFLALGILHLVYGRFVTGRAPPWPAALPGETVWTSLSAAIIAAAGVAILTGWRPRMPLVVTALIIAGWAGLRQIPLVVADTSLGVAWTQFGKAIWLAAGALAVAGTFPKEFGGTRLARYFDQERRFLLADQLCVAGFFLLTGVQHFLFAESVARLVPG